MSRRYYYSKKLSDYKWGIALISLLAVLTIALCVVTSGFRNWEVKTWFNNEPVCEHVFEDGKCTECGELELVEDEEDSDKVEDKDETDTKDDVVNELNVDGDDSTGYTEDLGNDNSNGNTNSSGNKDTAEF